VLAGEQLEAALLGCIAQFPQAAERLLACGGLLAAHNLAALVLQQVLARQTTLGVVGRAVEHLRLAANRHHVATTDHTRLVLVVGCVVHPFLTKQQIFFRGGQWAAGTLGRNDTVLQPVLDLRRYRFWI
jgi:hypothetical protein